LIKHLRARNIFCKRSTSVADILLEQTRGAGSQLEKVDGVIHNLARRKAARPRTIKTLRSTINALFANQLSHEELDALVAQLSQRGAINIVDGKVHYTLQS
jgi:hypothetical protein